MNIKNILHNSCTKDTVSIRKACPNDIPRLMEIFSIARKFMKDTGNPCHYQRIIPARTCFLPTSVMATVMYAHQEKRLWQHLCCVMERIQHTILYIMVHGLTTTPTRQSIGLQVAEKQKAFSFMSCNTQSDITTLSG